MAYKSERSKKPVLFSKLLQVFKSRASRIAGFQKFGIQHHAARLPMQELYAVTGTVYEDIHIAAAGVLTHGVGDDTAESMKAFAHISRAVIQQIAHTVIKAEHGCRPG